MKQCPKLLLLLILKGKMLLQNVEFLSWLFSVCTKAFSFTDQLPMSPLLMKSSLTSTEPHCDESTIQSVYCRLFAVAVDQHMLH